MDCEMPIMNGYEATFILKTRMRAEQMKKIPIYALTANNDETDRKTALNSGMDGILFKPLNVRELSQVLYKYS